MKKIVIGLVLIIILFGTTLVYANNSGDSKRTKSDEHIEKELIESMGDTSKEKVKLERLLTLSSEELKDKKIVGVGLSYSNEERILTAQVTDEGFLEVNKSKIENIIINTAKDVGFSDFDIDFRIVESENPQNKEDKKLMDSIRKVSNIVSNVLKNKGYNAQSFSITVNPKKEILIEGTDNDFSGDDEIEKVISNEVLSETNMDFTVRLIKKSQSEIRDQEWQPIFTAITEEANKRFNEYRGFAYSFHPQPLQIIIKTKLDDSWFDNSDSKVKEIENYVDKIIELKIEELSIEEIPYEIIVRDKNNKRIN